MGLNKIKEWQLDLSETNAKIEALGKAVTFKGRVDSVEQLPALGEDGDFWYVGPIEQENKEEYIWFDGRFELLGTTSKEDYNSLHNDLDELGDQVAEIESKIPESTSDTNPLVNKQQLFDEEMDIRADMNEMDSQLQTQINALAEAIQGGGGAGSNAYTRDNLLGGKDIDITPEPVEGGIDEHTVACWHFDGDLVDSISGTSANGTINTNNYKFGSSGLYSNKASTISYPYTNNIGTLDFWFLKNGTAKVNFGFDCTVVTNNLAGWIFRLNPSTNVIQFGKYNPSGSVWTVKEEKSYTFSSTEFIHLAAQRLDSLHYQLFVNGVLFMDVNADSLSGYNQKVSIESYSGGFFDEVRISDVARYDGDFTPPTQAYRVAVPTGRYLVNYTGESGAGKNIGEVYYSQSSLATDNAGALPLFTGETIASADTIYPDFYNWVTEHTELQATAEEYETAITNYGECPKYVLSLKVVTWTTGTYTIYSRQYPRYVSDFFSDKDCTKQLTPSDIGLSSYEEDGLKITEKDGNTVTILGNSSIINENVTFLPDVDFTSTGDTSSYQRYFTKESEEDYLSGSLRLPKKSLSHGVVIKEKKPTDIDPTWYRQWSDGWLEQGGTIETVNKTITFIKPFADTNYTLVGPGFYIGNAGNQTVTKTTTGFTTSSVQNVSATQYWEAKGQGVEGAQDETLYPWVFAYNASVPASTAQASEFQEGLSGKADTNLSNIPTNYDYIVETYNDGINWYRVYKSGWVVQGGYSTGATTITITFLKPFATETPTITCTGRTGNIVVHTTELSSTTFKWHDSATPESVGIFWRAEGQGA